jgi:pyruvate-formate lyase-activating enzyme
MNKYEETMFGKYGERYRQYRDAYNNLIPLGSLEFPLEIDLDVFDACNLRCPACHTIGRRRNSGKMPRGTLLAIAEECGAHGMPAVNVGGCGEPLMDAGGALEAVRAFAAAGVMDIFFHTNALLLDERTAEAMIGAGVTYLCVSIDAATPETYAKARGASLESVLGNVRKFLGIRGSLTLPALRVSFLENSVNTGERDSFISQWSGKADFVDIQRYYKSYESQPDPAAGAAPTAAGAATGQAAKKRMAVVAPDYLCATCGGFHVTDAVSRGDTLARHKTIKSYWDGRRMGA